MPNTKQKKNKVKKLKENETYLIFWKDSKSEDGWKDRKEMKDSFLDKTLEMVTVGLFLKETKESFVFTMSITEDFDLVDYSLQIPKVAITEIKILK